MKSVLIRALRLPFITASVLPFVFGSLIFRQNFNLSAFLLGLIAVAAMHLSANLINDYADSKSGVDWQDKNFYKFFGGSKLIQEKILSEKFYLRLSVFFSLLAAVSVMALALILKSFLVIGMYLAILFLGWSYSTRPLSFSYHRFGELVIFFLFGPVPVMGGYFIQTGIFPDGRSFLLSLPFGFLTTAILFANEVPDWPQDKKVGKLTWVSITGEKKAFILYALLITGALVSVCFNVISGYLNPVALLCFLLFLPAVKATMVLKKDFQNKIKLMGSSKLTIVIQTSAGIILILGLLL